MATNHYLTNDGLVDRRKYTPLGLGKLMHGIYGICLSQQPLLVGNYKHCLVSVKQLAIIIACIMYYKNRQNWIKFFLKNQ